MGFDTAVPPHTVNIWHYSNSCDPRTRVIADRHYSRQKPGTMRFVPPGRCVTFIAPTLDAYWVTSWPFAEFVRHAWAGAWICSAFRNEAGTSNGWDPCEMVWDAVAATRHHYEVVKGLAVPDLGMITFVAEEKVKSRNPGYCYRKAGFKRLKERTKVNNCVVLQMLPEDMPPPKPARPFVPY